jgi:hypothetical protein
VAKWFCGFGFAWPAIAAQPSFSVRAVIADSAIAAWHAGANRRHQQSLEGRLDHRGTLWVRQREYRRRRAQRAPQTTVTDHGSLLIASPASFECGKANATAIEVPPRSNAAGLPVGRKNGPAYAGAAGSVVEPRVSLTLSQAFHEESEFS